MGNGKKVLIVDDDIMAAMFLEESLLQNGFMVTDRVPKGEMAVESAVKNKPDVVLMDIQLAGKLNGIQTAQQILSLTPVSVIFITGYDSEQIRDQAKELNPLAYLIKPTNIVQIIDMLSEDTEH